MKNKQGKQQGPKPESNQEKSAAARKADFFALFKAEAPYIRDEIARDLPAYHMLLSMQAESFADIALRVIAKQRGIPFDLLNPPVPACPSCGKDDRVSRKGRQGYYCKRCAQKFQATHNAIVSNSKVGDLKFLQVLTSLLAGHSMTQTCELCDISLTTYYRIRNKILYAMQLMLREVVLYGVIQADCTFVRVSYKGLDLREPEFDEDSLFYDKTAFIPREARKRGGAYKAAERNANSICILSLIDEYGHTANIFCGTGLASLKTLKMYVPEGKLRLSVPENDPFQTFLQKKKRNIETKPGDTSLLVIDKERALESYAQAIGIHWESHVYRDKGTQRRLAAGAHDIQRINSMHSRLKRFLSAAPVSSKYLPGYLTLFDFMEMTGGSKAAVERLLEILATPGLGQSPEFYQSLFSVPNYLEQWFAGDHPLKKLPYNRLLAFYLYDHIRNKESYPGTDMTMRYVEQACGYSDKHIRSSYQNLLNAGYRDLILSYFGEVVASKERATKPMKNIPPIIPLLHDEWTAYLRGEQGPRPTFTQFVKKKQAQYGFSYNETYVKRWFARAEELGVCPHLPPKEEWVPVARNIPEIVFALYDEWAVCLREENGPCPPFSKFYRAKKEQYGVKYAYGTLQILFQDIQALKLRPPLPMSSKASTDGNVPSKRNIEICDEYDRLVKEQKALGRDGLSSRKIQELLGQRYGLSEFTVAQCVYAVRKYKKMLAAQADGINPEEQMSHENTRCENRADVGARNMALSQFNPAVAARWHPTKNGTLTADQVSYGSAKIIWWLCPDCGYEWESEVRRQTRKLKCPACTTTQRLKERTSSFADIHPELVKQWHPVKNGRLKPEMFSCGSAKKVWWLCECGHEWQARISARAAGGGCPSCAVVNRRKAAVNQNGSLLDKNPKLAAEWHPSKNGPLTPAQVTSSTPTKAWWLCPDCGHEWEATIGSRHYGKGCPQCYRQNRTKRTGP